MKDDGGVATVSAQNRPSIEYKFCVLYRGNIWYVVRSLPRIRESMSVISKEASESEQNQIQKWLEEMSINEH